MKISVIIFMLFSIMACDPLAQGFKKNTAYVLDVAFKAIQNADKKSFREVTAKEALCLYGNDSGLDLLKENLDFNLEEVEISPKLQDSRHFSSPIFVGYWSYYQERYGVEIFHRIHNKLIVEGIVDCDFGTDEQKNDRLINQKPSRYKKKECRIVKILPKSFPGIPEQKKCGIFKS